MSEKVIVLVCDRGDSKHGEVTVLDDSQKAERLVETLLEAGFEGERIRVFTGRESEFQISHRPVVALVDEEGAGQQPAAEGESRGAEPKQPVAGEPAVGEPVAVAGGAGNSAGSAATVATKEEAQPPAAEVATPVRFSSLFRSA